MAARCHPGKEVFLLEGCDRYTVTCLSYSGARSRPDGITAHYDYKQVVLTGNDGREIYRYDITENRLFLKIIRHREGREYIIFNIDLYGYSVLEPETGAVVHYVPVESFEGGETFIWMDAFYCAENNLLVVDGCYWACP